MLLRLLLSALILGLLFVVITANEKGPEQSAPAMPPARAIPGIVAADNFPGACVDCHINYVEMNLDTRFSTLLSHWSEKVESKLLVQARAAALAGMTLEGKHPKVLGMIKNIPGDCLTCHSRESTTAPPFARLLHLIHLTGGQENHFLTLFQGECTHCHKLNMTSGQWAIPSGPEH